MSGQVRSNASLAAELNQLRESLENAFQRVNVLEEQLRRTSRGNGLEPIIVEVFHVFGPARRAPTAPPMRKPDASDLAWSGSGTASPALRPTPGLANLTLADRALPVVAFSVCGFNRDELQRIVAVVAGKQAKDRNFLPLFLTDNMAADIFRRHRYAFEYFPSPATNRPLAGTTSWQDYANARLDMLKRKYAITRIIQFGRRAFGQLQEP